ncbi:hypothetical protein LTR37_019897 [Vermiconidia calcicola]|uniref:Uncharacterized protein n=1 Tax=Vermiconidia calcicola TaxID=1690605 RepID=A0ACC3MFV4_9PEZI|nr:hypothetical protein LTR37_019897 [Vermiconidia calcicola]
MRFLPLAIILGLYLAATTAQSGRTKLQACPLLGQQYPPPVQLTAEPKFQAAAKSLNAVLDKSVKQSPYNETSFSVGVFSTDDDQLIYQYHYTSAAVRNSSTGTKAVDADSIYRIGSISKLLTVYLFLISQGDRKWDVPVVEYLPQLRDLSEQSWNSMTPNWEDITLGDLASQMAGLARDYGLADLAPTVNGLVPLPTSLKNTFPNITEDEVPKCNLLTPDGGFARCTVDGKFQTPHAQVRCVADLRIEYLRGVASESPIFSAAYTPVYSNEAFAILGLALQNITGIALETLFDDSIVKPLKLEGTSWTVPEEVTDNALIPGDPVEVGWSNEFGPFSPAGGFFSSTRDAARIGRAMLTSELLSKTQTNRWMKPTSFVEDFAQGVGRPWEIYRLKVNGASVDVYTKGGDWGAYHTLFALIPTFNVGFTVFTAPDLGVAGSIREAVPAFLTDNFLPVLDEIAEDQATANFAGRYASSEANSSMTVSTTSSRPGLMVTQWINNGVDLLGFLDTVFPNMSYRIVPNQLYSGDRIGFTSFYQAAAAPPDDEGIWLFNCPGWFAVDALTFGNIPVGQMVFDVGKGGKAGSVELRGMRVMLEKQF